MVAGPNPKKTPKPPPIANSAPPAAVALAVLPLTVLCDSRTVPIALAMPPPSENAASVDWAIELAVLLLIVLPLTVKNSVLPTPPAAAIASCPPASSAWRCCR